MISRRILLQISSAGGLAAAGGLEVFASSTRAAQRYKVRIINTYSNQTKALQTLLKNKAWLEEYGVDATTENVADGSKVTAALLSRSSDICLLSGFGQVLSAIEKGAALKVVAGASILAAQAIYAKNPAIRSVKDLEGRTIGTGSIGALAYEQMVLLLEEKNVNVKTVRFVNVGSSEDIFKAVVAGAVDAGPALYDVYEQQAQYGVHSLVDGNLWTELPEFVGQGSYAADAAIRDNREGLVRTLAAYCKMYRFLSEPGSEEDYIKAHREGVGGEPKASDEQASSQWRFFQKYKPFATNLVLTEKQVDYMQDLNLRFGAQKRRLPIDQLADMSLATAAIKLIG